MSQSYDTLPDNLPVPEDDGACDHLTGQALPDVALSATSGGLVNPSRLPGRVVLYCYPMTGKPGVPLPDGWLTPLIVDLQLLVSSTAVELMGWFGSAVARSGSVAVSKGEVTLSSYDAYHHLSA